MSEWPKLSFHALLSFSLRACFVFYHEVVFDDDAPMNIFRMIQRSSLAFTSLSMQAYLESGCTGSFTDYRSDSSTSSSTSDLTDLSTVADTTTNGRGVSTSMLVAVSSACGAVALVAGYIAGQQEGEALGYSGDERSPLLQSNKGGRLWMGAITLGLFEWALTGNGCTSPFNATTPPCFLKS